MQGAGWALQESTGPLRATSIGAVRGWPVRARRVLSLSLSSLCVDLATPWDGSGHSPTQAVLTPQGQQVAPPSPIPHVQSDGQVFGRDPN